MHNTKHQLLFINGNLYAGGVEKSLLAILANLDYSRYDVDLLLFDDTGLPDTILPNDVRLIIHKASNIYGPFLRTVIQNLLHNRWKDNLLRFALSLSRLLGNGFLKAFRPVFGIRKHYDCAFSLRFGLPGALLSSVVESNKKYYWWHYGGTHFDNREIQEVRKTVKTDYVITVSEAVKENLIKQFSFNEDTVFVIPNIIDIPNVERAAGTINPFPGDSGPILVSVGRFAPEKHIEEIPDIAERLIHRGVKSFKWYIVGNGTTFESIKKKIQDYHLFDQVVLLGWRQNPYPYIKFADILVHTSHVEAQCLTLLEAMALKTPCVVTKTVIPQAFAEHNKTCLVSEQNVESQVENVLKMIDSLKVNQRMVTNAYEMVLKAYSPSTVIPQIEALIMLD